MTFRRTGAGVASEALSGVTAGIFNVEDYGAVADNSTDCTTAIRDALADVVAAGGGTVWFPDIDGTYVVSGALQTTGGCRAQIPLPVIPNTQQKIAIRFAGPLAGIMGPMWGQTAIQTNGPAIRSTLTAQTHTAAGKPCVIGGPDIIHADPPDPDDFSNIQVIFENLRVCVPNNPTITAINLERVNQARFQSFMVDVNIATDSITPCTSPHAFGIVMPARNNNAITSLDATGAMGFYGGIVLGEHSQGSLIALYKNRVGLVPHSTFGSHLSQLTNVGSEWCLYDIAGVDPATGVIAVDPGDYTYVPLTITGMSIEDGAAPWAKVEHVHDTNDALRGSLTYTRILTGVGLVEGPLTVDGAADFYMQDVGATHPLLTFGTLTEASLIDNSGGTADGTLQSIGAVYSQTEIRNNFADLATKVNNLIADMRASGVYAASASHYDTFTRADSVVTLGTSTSGHSYTTRSSTWGIATNRAYLVSSASGGNQVVMETGLADTTVEVDIVPQAAGRDFGLVFRESDANNFLLIGMGAGLEVYRKQAGAFTLLDSDPMTFTTGVSYRIKAVLSGSSILLYVDDVEMFNLTSAFNQTATKHGLYDGIADGSSAHRARFDNFAVGGAMP